MILITFKNNSNNILAENSTMRYNGVAQGCEIIDTVYHELWEVSTLFRDFLDKTGVACSEYCVEKGDYRASVSLIEQFFC